MTRRAAAMLAALVALATAPIPGTPVWFVGNDTIDDAPRGRAGSDFQRWQRAARAASKKRTELRLTVLS